VVFLVVLVAGAAIIGFDARDIEYQVVALIAFASGFVCLFTLYHREDRARERAEGRFGGRDADSGRGPS
jgi:uncharacterized membrane protein